MANNTELLYEGKAKKLYKGEQAGTLIQYFKDDATAFNAQKKDGMDGCIVVSPQQKTNSRTKSWFY